jgi:hypothetical protein
MIKNDIFSLITYSAISIIALHSTENTNSDSNDVEQFISAKYMPYVDKSYHDFKKKNQKFDCFDMYVDENEGIVEVSFVNLNVEKIDSDTIVIPTGSKGKCGLGVTYRYFPSGKVEKVFQR